MLDEIKGITEQLAGLEEEKRELLKQMHKEHHSVSEVEEAIR
jgi:hypothetical protein